MTLRVVHCGSGSSGKRALAGILDHPDLELVGQYVWSKDKVGVDAGLLCGKAPCGVKTSNNWQELVDLKADCLSYFGRAMPGSTSNVDEMLPFLAAGTNVVNFSAFEYAHPPSAPAEPKRRIEEACKAGRSTLFFTGIDPGWATTDLAIAALAAADRVDCVRVLELGWFGSYPSQSLREVFGFGLKPGELPGMMRDGKMEGLWKPTLLHIADILGVEIDDWERSFEIATLDHDIEAGIGTVKAGTAVVIHFELRAMSGGAPIVVVEQVDSIARGAAEHWKAPHAPVDLVHRVEIEGSPSFSLEVAYARDGSAGGCTVMPVINAIPAVCAARPGLLGPLDIPRYWGRNVRKSARRAPGPPPKSYNQLPEG
jgi:hypothetical protein